MSLGVFRLRHGGQIKRLFSFVAALIFLLATKVAFAQTDHSQSAVDKADAASQVKTSNSTEPLEQKKTDKRPKFNIWEIRVDGNTVLPVVAIQQAIYPFVGLRKTIQDVEAARLELEKLYKNSGYPAVIVNIPQQKVKNGIIHLAVIEGVVERLRVSGSKYHTLSGIKERVPSLTSGAVFNVVEVKSDIAKLNQLSPDLSLSPMLKPGRQTGALEVDLQVSDNLPVHGSLELNNRHSSSTENLRLIGSLSYNNLWQKFHSLSLQYQTSPEDTDQVSVMVGTYLFPVNDNRDRIAIYAVKSESSVPSLVDSVLGKGHILGLRYVSIFPNASFYSHSSSLGFDYKNFEDTVFSGGYSGGDISGSTTPIKYLQVNAQYSGVFRLEHSKTKISFGASFGLSAFNDAEEFLNKRLALTQENAKPNYFYNSFSISQEFNWSNWELKLGGEMQYTDDLLISNEQFAIGGDNSVRGYFESQHLGDRGSTGYVEFWAPNVFGQSLWSKRWFGLRPYVFYDTANTKVTIPSQEEVPEYSLDSAGVGIDLLIAKKLKGRFQWANALVNSGEVEVGDERLHFNVQFEF